MTAGPPGVKTFSTEDKRFFYRKKNASFNPPGVLSYARQIAPLS